MSDDELPDWHWRVVVYTRDRGKTVYGAHEPHRAAAKQHVQANLASAGDSVRGWGDTYIPRDRVDCPYCGGNESLTDQPNCRGQHDWECHRCNVRAYGTPGDWGRWDTSFVRDESWIRTGHLRAEIDGESDA